LKYFTEVRKGIATSISLGIISSSDTSPEKPDTYPSSISKIGNSRGSKGFSHDDRKKASNQRVRLHKRDRHVGSVDSTNQEDELTDYPPKKDQKGESTSVEIPDRCDGCGLPNHSKGGCKHKKHPGFNNSKFLESKLEWQKICRSWI